VISMISIATAEVAIFLGKKTPISQKCLFGSFLNEREYLIALPTEITMPTTIPMTESGKLKKHTNP
jgi:hypothetical protein